MDFDLLIEGSDLFYTEFPEGWTFTWRLLSIKEYAAFCKVRSAGLFTDDYVNYQVFRRCYAGDPDAINKHMPLWIPLSIGDTIMWLSGDCESTTIKDDISEARATYVDASMNETMKRIILLAYPNEEVTDLDKLNRRALVRRFVAAESFLQLKTGSKYVPLDVEKIVPAIEVVTQDPDAIQTINFGTDNKLLQTQIHPWEEIDRLEQEEVPQPQSKRLSKAQAAKLDQMTRQRR